MKFEAMLKMLFLFLSRRRLTSAFLADQCEISRRTVFRYIEELSLAGVPIVAEQGRDGGYYISETYRLSAPIAVSCGKSTGSMPSTRAAVSMPTSMPEAADST